MGTRGFVGFVYQGRELITYNHFDSYPGGVGVQVLNWLRGIDLKTLPEAVGRLRLVDEDAVPSPEEVASLGAVFGDPTVGGPMSNQEIRSYYQLLRGTQGDPASILLSGLIIDSHDFPLSSLYCEWGYLVDLDRAAFEVYRGFQHEPPKFGRWAGRVNEPEGYPISDSYQPVERIAEWSLERLPEADEFVKGLELAAYGEEEA